MDKNEISPLDKLDIILYNFSLDKNGLVSWNTYNDISENISSHLKLDKTRPNYNEVITVFETNKSAIMGFLNNWQLEILQKLIDDKYLVKSESLVYRNETDFNGTVEETYSITFEGRVFYQEGENCYNIK